MNEISEGFGELVDAVEKSVPQMKDEQLLLLTAMDMRTMSIYLLELSKRYPDSKEIDYLKSIMAQASVAAKHVASIVYAEKEKSNG